MKRIDEYSILSNERINENDVYEIILVGNSYGIKPGQFVQVRLPGKFLSRPFSIAYHTDDTIHIVYRVVGSGTEAMSNLVEGEKLTLFTGLGNGFDLEVDTKNPLLIGGGTGVAPLYDLLCSLIDRGIDVKVLLGFRNENDSFYVSKFEELAPSYVSYESNEKYRYVTDYIKEFHEEGIDYDYFYGCGPKPMLKAVNDVILSDGEVSLEARMACGFGQCKCCSIETNEGMKTVCKEGPVFKKTLVKW